MLLRKSHAVLSLGLSLLVCLLAAAFATRPALGSTGAVGLIAYERGNEIRLVNSDGSNDRRVWQEPLPAPNFKGVRGLQWRPDGGALTFASDYQQLCSVYDGDIFTINADGSGLKRLTNSPACAGLAGFPKGTVRVEVENQTTESEFLIYVEGAPTAEVINIAPGAAVAITFPNVADLGSIQQQIVLINGHFRWYDAAVFVDVQAGQTAEASTRLILTGSNAYRDMGATYPAWHRSGAQVGFIFYDGILLKIAANPPVSGDDVLLLAPGAGAIATSLSWSPIDDSVLYTGIDSIFIVQPGAPNPGTPLIDKGGSQLWLGLDWLPDGSGFVFSATGGPIGQENSNIYRYTFADEELVVLTDFEDEYAGALSVSPNGREVAFEYADDAGDPSQLWIVGIDGANPHPIGIQGESPDWKPGTGIDFTNWALLPMIVDR